MALGSWSLAAGPEWGLLAARVWISHIGLDRALGFGLKYPTGFSDQHLARAGDRLRHVHHPQHLRPAVSGDHRCAHQRLFFSSE